MANEIAKQLIYRLRNDPLVREHFGIEGWCGKGTCGTVGCIAGTAMVMVGESPGAASMRRGKEILGISHLLTACHLFAALCINRTKAERVTP